jgi:hypothetical protein
MTINPVGGYRADRKRAGIVPVLGYDADGGLSRVELHPFVHRHKTVGESGLPFRADPASSEAIIEHLTTLSEPFGTRIDFDADAGIGVIPLNQ